MSSNDDNTELDEIPFPPKKKRRRRKVWTVDRLQRRSVLLSQENIIEQLQLEPPDFFDSLKINVDTYMQLLNLVKPFIERRNTFMREAITAHDRLSATLRYISSGRTFSDLKYSSVVSSASLSAIIPETCEVLYKVLAREYMKFPTTQEEWQGISSEFEDKLNFPNCGGVLDGRHVSIMPPHNSGSYFLNHKDYFSIILMALVNANLEFVMVDVGKNGHFSDGTVLEETLFYEKLIEGKLNLPKNDATKNGMNFVFIADEASEMTQNILKAYPDEETDHEKRIFNYRLSRARRMSEMAFGVLATRFRVLHSYIRLKPEKTDKVIMSCCALHNFLMRNCRESYCPESLLDFEDLKNGCVVDGQWRTLLGDVYFSSLQVVEDECADEEAEKTRSSYVEYFNGPGKVPWQEKMVRPTQNNDEEATSEESSLSCHQDE